jgi:peptide/nickel transport system substrate-binding protein
MRQSKLAGLVAFALLFVACTAAPAPGERAAGDGGAGASRGAPVRLAAAIRGLPPSMIALKTNRSVGSIPGLDAIEELLHAGLTHADEQAQMHAQLAEAVPTLENGLWRISPDGRMETTWRIRPDARWHDGTPVTTDDIRFGALIEQDTELGIPRPPVFDLIDQIDTPDARTVVVQWKQPYIEADALFGYIVAGPLPAHILEGPYRADKASFPAHPYWTTAYVGAGPYKLRDWVTDSHVVVVANDDYVLGRPKIDEIEVRFIVDHSALTANLLAGSVSMALGRSLVTVEQADAVRAQLPDFKTVTSFRSWYRLAPQFLNTDPPVVADARFRRALMHAVDRDALNDSFTGGQSAIAHTWVAPDTREYREIDASIVKYPYDPRRATQMVEALGYTRAADGLLVDGAGQRIRPTVWTTTRAELQPKIVLAIVDGWKQAGIDAEPNFIPPQQIGDREMRAQFPAFEMILGPNGLRAEDVMRYHGSNTPLPENGFRVTGNNARYRNPEFDALLERYITTIPRAERIQTLGQIVRHQTEELTWMGLIYDVDVTLFSGRIANVRARGDRATQAWNAHEWELRRG